MLIANNISYTIGSKSILRDISFTLEPGEFKAVVGPNGAGKSSLLKIVVGENKSYKGKVQYHGKQLETLGVKEISKLRAVLPQESQVNFPFTVQEIVEMGRTTFREKKSHLDKVVHEAMKGTGIIPFRDRNYHTLSGGEKQKVQLTRVMAQIWDSHDFSKFIFLDEPTANLDMAQQHQILGLARQLCKKNIGIFAVIHDLNLAAQYADNLMFIKKGGLICQGPVKEVMNKQNIEKTFDHEVTMAFDEINEAPYILPKRNQHINNNTIGKNLNYNSYEQIDSWGLQ